MSDPSSRSSVKRLNYIALISMVVVFHYWLASNWTSGHWPWSEPQACLSNHTLPAYLWGFYGKLWQTPCLCWVKQYLHLSPCMLLVATLWMAVRLVKHNFCIITVCSLLMIKFPSFMCLENVSSLSCFTAFSTIEMRLISLSLDRWRFLLSWRQKWHILAFSTQKPLPYHHKIKKVLRNDLAMP